MPDSVAQPLTAEQVREAIEYAEQHVEVPTGYPAILRRLLDSGAVENWLAYFDYYHRMSGMKAGCPEFLAAYDSYVRLMAQPTEGDHA